MVGDCDVSWRATLQLVVTQSTTKAEYMAIPEACKEYVWLKCLYVELLVMILALTCFVTVKLLYT
jgi:hypothetical protein